MRVLPVRSVLKHNPAPAAATAVLVLLAAVAVADDWPQWRGPNRDGVSKETGWTTDWPGGRPKELWAVPVGVGYSSVSVAGGRVYTMGNAGGGSDVVWCLNANTGAAIWKHRYPCGKGSYPGTRMTPTVDGDAVYTLSREGHLFCLDAADGAVRWTVDVTREFGVRQSAWGWGLACSPLVLGDRLILDLGKAIALNKKTGAVLWQSGSDVAGYSSPVVVMLGELTCVTAFSNQGLRVLDASNGQEKGHYQWETRYGVNVVTPIVSGDRIFISSGYNRGCALFQVSLAGLRSIYENKNMRTHVTTCVLWQGRLYGFDGQQDSRSARLVCLDFQTGREVWSQPGLKPGGLVIADGKLVILADGGELIIAPASPAGFRPMARAKVLTGTCWTQPVLADGRIYCRSHSGRLVCLDVRGR